MKKMKLLLKKINKTQIDKMEANVNQTSKWFNQNN